MVDAGRLKALLAEGLGLPKIFKGFLEEFISELLAAEANDFIESHRHERLPDGRRRVVRNGYSTFSVLSFNGELSIKRPVVRDLSPGGGDKISFESSIVPNRLCRTPDLEKFILWLYFRGIPANDFSGALSCILGDRVKGLSPSGVSRISKEWVEEHDLWAMRGIDSSFAYLWAEGIRFRVKDEADSQCVLVALGAKEDGRTELLGLAEGLADSHKSWRELFARLKGQGLKEPPLVIGDAGQGIWAGLRDVFPGSKAQSCWLRQAKEVNGYLPKERRGDAEARLKSISLSPTVEEAERGIKAFIEDFRGEFPKAADSIERNQKSLLAFYGFPSGHWPHIRANEPIESLFSAVRNHSHRPRGRIGPRSLRPMIFKFCQIALEEFRPLSDRESLKDVLKGREYKNGAPAD
jgi:transposase-like protein